MNNDEFKTTVERKSYYLRNVKKFLLEITTKKISEEEALKLYSDLIIPDIAELEKSNSKSKDRRANILNVLKNLESVFTGISFHHDNVPKPESEQIIAERTKLQRQRSDEIAKKEKTISPELFKRYF